jgi:hypothetical protein
MIITFKEGHARQPLAFWEHKHAKQAHFKVRILLELLNCGTMFVSLLLRIFRSLFPLLNHTCARLQSTSLVLPTLLTYLAHTHLSRLNKKSSTSFIPKCLSLSFHYLCLFILCLLTLFVFSLSAFSFSLPFHSLPFNSLCLFIICLFILSAFLFS